MDKHAVQMCPEEGECGYQWVEMLSQIKVHHFCDLQGQVAVSVMKALFDFPPRVLQNSHEDAKAYFRPVNSNI